MKLKNLQKPFRDKQDKTLEDLEKVIHKQSTTVYKSIKGLSEGYNDKYNGEVLPGRVRKQLNKDIASKTATSLSVTTLAMDKALTETLNDIYSGYSYSYSKISNSYIDYKALTPKQLNVIKLDKIQGKTYIDRLNFHSKNLNETVSAAIQNGIRNGRTNQDIAKMIAKRVNVSESHALTIAKTETGRIGSQGAEMAREKAVDHGLVFVRTWVHYASANPRHDHISMDGVKVKHDEGFILPSGSTCMQPRTTGVASDDINCLCEVIEEFEGFESKTRRQETEIVDVGTYDHYLKANKQ